mmetsp:Transcript_31781/g.62459  ORF Transcript_31781/g.62459 Transcript_31781/m.62459 type:complete len:201 (+) Transcript_31781:366-968(+)
MCASRDRVTSSKRLCRKSPQVPSRNSRLVWTSIPHFRPSPMVCSARSSPAWCRSKISACVAFDSNLSRSMFCLHLSLFFRVISPVDLDRSANFAVRDLRTCCTCSLNLSCLASFSVTHFSCFSWTLSWDCKNLRCDASACCLSSSSRCLRYSFSRSSASACLFSIWESRSSSSPTAFIKACSRLISAARKLSRMKVLSNF